MGRGLRSLLWPWPQWAEQAQTWGEGPAADSNGGPSPPPPKEKAQEAPVSAPSPRAAETPFPSLWGPWLCAVREGGPGAGMGGGGGAVRSWAGQVPWCSHVTQSLAWQHWESLGAWAPGLLPLPGPAPTCLLMGGCPGMLRRRGASGVSGPGARLTSGGDSAATGLSRDRRGSCCRRDVLGLDV